MVFRRPGKFRWTYKAPYEQEIISDGQTLWIFDIDLDQVTLRNVDEELQHSPIAILNQPARIAELYQVEILDSRVNRLQFKLLPTHQEAMFRSVTLVFSGEKLTGMNILDNFDQYNNLAFRNIELNTEPDNRQFQFTPPEGVDIINATVPSHRQ